MKRQLFILSILFVLNSVLFITSAQSANRFFDFKDGTIYDAQSNIVWLKNANCFGMISWYNANTISNSLAHGQCELSDSSQVGDWHLPTIEELRIFTDSGLRYNDLNLLGFVNVQLNGYWSSSIYPDYRLALAWYVDMGGGIVDYNYTLNFLNVWPIRGGQLWSFDSLIIKESAIFGNRNVEATSEPKQLTLYNTNATVLPITAITMTGANPDQFSVAAGGAVPCSSLTPTLAAGEKCTLNLTFVPTSKGAKNANLTFGANGKSHDFPVTGTGVTTIMGTVIDLSSGNPLANATMTISGGATAHSDVSGNFIFSPSLPNSVYTVIISKTSYSTATYNNVIILDTRGTTLNVGLAPSGTFNIITPDGPLAHAETGNLNNQRINITGGTGPYTFTVDNGTILPPGLTIDPAIGSISGTPTKVGSYSFDILVTDSLNKQAIGSYSIEVTAPLSITTDAFPRGTRALFYPKSITATGGTQPYTFVKTVGSLPTGLSLSTNGIITGTPSVTGSFTFTVGLTDTIGRTASKSYIIIVDEPLSQPTARLVDGISNTPYTQTLTASGGFPPYSWSVYSGALPAGLTLDSVSGVISGTPLGATQQPVIIAARDSIGRINFKTFACNVFDPLRITTTALPNGLVGDAYFEGVRTLGGNSPFTFSYVGIMPTGINPPNGSTGVIGGTPTAAGLKNFEVTVTDSSWPTPQSFTQSLSLRTTANLTITTSAILPHARIGLAISPITLTANGGPSPFTWSVLSGYLPDGITLNVTTGSLSGTPTDFGDFIFTIRCADTTGTTADKQFFLHISNMLAIVTDTLPDGSKGTPYVALFGATGGLKNYTWAVKSGSLPAGLYLDPVTGTISGVPTAKINSTITVEVTDSDAPAQKASRSYIIDVWDTLTIYEQSLPNARLKQTYSANIRAQLGSAPYTWRVVNGVLPFGTSLKQNGGVATVEGTVTATGTSTFTLEVSDSGAPVQTVRRTYTVVVYPDLTMTTTDLKTAIRGTPYIDTIVATGGAAPLNYNIIGGPLPLGLVFNSSSGDITGNVIMDASQSALFTVRATDSGYPFASVEKQFTIPAVNPLAISTTVIHAALQKSFNTFTFSGQGGLSPQNWSKVSGNLPASMSLDPVTGILSGTTPVCGIFDFTLQLADASAIPLTIQQQFQLSVLCSNDYDLTGSVGVAGVTVALTGDSVQTVTSGKGGAYLFPHLTNGGYTVTPQFSPKTFQPLTRQIILNNQDVSSANFTVATANLSVVVAGSGGGSVNSNPVGIATTSGMVTATFDAGTPVNLTSLPNSLSTFGTWGGACSGVDANCLVSLPSDKSVTATFTRAPNAMIGSVGYATVNEAYKIAPVAGEATILTLDTELAESLTLDRGISVKLMGGYKAEYLSRSVTPTVLKGKLTIGTGSLIVDGVAVR